MILAEMIDSMRRCLYTHTILVHLTKGGAKLENKQHKEKIDLLWLLRFLFSKLVVVGLLIAIQALVIIFSIIKLADYFTIIYAILTVLGIAIVVWLVSKDENPSYKLAWVILVMALPIFGGLFYLMFGNKNMPKQLLERIRASEQIEKELFTPSDSLLPKLESHHDQLVSMARFIQNTTGAPIYQYTRSEYLPLGEIMWQRMLEELQKAERFIFMEYFILQEGEMWTPILAILKEKAAKGLDVRFMYDDLGSIQTISRGYHKQLEEWGIKSVLFNPFKPHLNSVMNYRDHRKILVIDGNVGFCGGINIADEYINAYEKHGHWKDTGVLLKGEGVWPLTAMFLSLWNFSRSTDTDFEPFRPTLRRESDGYVQAFGDSPLDHINVSEESYMQIINRATRYVYITTPYLILDHEMITALQMAARSGVDVRIITPHVPDKWLVHETTRSFYRPLLKTGIRIYEYTPGFVHAKMYVADDKVAIVGTANMDFRSFYLHFECGVCFYQSSVVSDVRDDMLQMLDQCTEVFATDYVSIWRRLVRALLRLFSPMM